MESSAQVRRKIHGQSYFFEMVNRYSDTSSALSEFVVATWVVNCPHCRKTFEHSQIEKSFVNIHFPEKPKFSKAGQSLACENYGKKSVYHGMDLRCQR